MIEASVHVNGDDAFLAWRMEPTTDCWGFAIYREIYRDGKVLKSGYLYNRVGFKDDKPKPNESRPSTEWPFQRYTWTDHGVGEGDEVAYWVSPVLVVDGSFVVDEDNEASAGPATVTSAVKNGAAYFNRGCLLSQFMLKELPPGWSTLPHDKKLPALTKLKKSLENDALPLRKFLMGDLGKALADLLATEKAKGSTIHAALYELSDKTLISALGTFGKKAHVVLANGSSQNSRQPKTPKDYVDGNADAAEALTDKIDLIRRMFFSSQGLGHNKFLVVSRGGKPKAVWTGSTNWATTGLCTQANNAVLLEDPALAALYLDQWKRLAADNEPVPDRGVDAPVFGADLTTGNDKVHVATSGGVTSRVWFTRTSNGSEIQEVVDLVNGAKHAVFFLLFEPGKDSKVVKAINARRGTDPDLHIHGVINTIKTPDPSAPEGGAEVDVSVVAPGKPSSPFRLDIVQPDGVEDPLSSWAAEVTRREFIMGAGGVIGHAIVHSKTIVIDPFTKPVVITGSHNLSGRASTHNDENLLIRSGDGALAERYAVQIMGVYQHYRWRQYLRDCKKNHTSPFEYLDQNDEWQSKLTDTRQRELDVWL